MTDGNDNTNGAASRDSFQLAGSTWFVTRRYGFDIREVTVTRESEKSVWIWNPYREKLIRSSKHTQYEDYWRSRTAAKVHLLERAKRARRNALWRASEMAGHIARLSNTEMSNAG